MCSPAQAAQLAPYDHHRVYLDGRAAVILTYHWPPTYDDSDTLTLYAVFRYAEQHPLATADIQAIVDQLAFAPPS